MEIVVNGKKQIIVVAHLSYDDVAVLAGQPDAKELTITYYAKSAGDRHRAGTLIPGRSIDVEDGMVFNAVHTGNA